MRSIQEALSLQDNFFSNGSNDFLLYQHLIDGLATERPILITDAAATEYIYSLLGECGAAIRTRGVLVHPERAVLSHDHVDEKEN
jgi:hypothetical protein